MASRPNIMTNQKEAASPQPSRDPKIQQETLIRDPASTLAHWESHGSKATQQCVWNLKSTLNCLLCVYDEEGIVFFKKHFSVSGHICYCFFLGLCKNNTMDCGATLLRGRVCCWDFFKHQTAFSKENQQIQKVYVWICVHFYTGYTIFNALY